MPTPSVEQAVDADGARQRKATNANRVRQQSETLPALPPTHQLRSAHHEPKGDARGAQHHAERSQGEPQALTFAGFGGA